MKRSGTDRIADAYYEFGCDLVGGLPSDIPPDEDHFGIDALL